MKKLLLFGILSFVVLGCGKKKDFSVLKTGMKTSEVLQLVGEPEQKIPVVMFEWWQYTKDNKMVVIANDTVVNIAMDLKASQDSMKTASEGVRNMLDKLK